MQKKNSDKIYKKIKPNLIFIPPCLYKVKNFKIRGETKMKKTLKTFIAIILIVMTMSAVCLPAMATNVSDLSIPTNTEDVESFLNDAKESQNEFEEFAKNQMEKFKKEREKEQKSQFGKFFSGISTAVIILIILHFTTIITGIILVLILAPRKNLSRAFIVLPLFMGILGLIAFFIVYAFQDSQDFGNTPTYNCPHCGAALAIDTKFCGVCGNRVG